MQPPATHLPIPSQKVPPRSVQAVPFGAKVAVHMLVLQCGVAQAVPVAGQSASARQAAQMPLPSQSTPPLSEQVWPTGALALP